MARVEVSAAAVADLERMIASHSLPRDTKQRVRRALELLGRFPRLGPQLEERWSGYRFILGPWRWMLLIYVHMEADDRVVVVTIQDARSSAAATSSR